MLDGLTSEYQSMKIGEIHADDDQERTALLEANGDRCPRNL